MIVLHRECDCIYWARECWNSSDDAKSNSNRSIACLTVLVSKLVHTTLSIKCKVWSRLLGLKIYTDTSKQLRLIITALYLYAKLFLQWKHSK